MGAENAEACLSAYLPADYLLSDNTEITLSLNRARDFFNLPAKQVRSFTPNESAIVSRQGMFLSSVGWSGGASARTTAGLSPAAMK
jgi:hypothetical protein